MCLTHVPLRSEHSPYNWEVMGSSITSDLISTSLNFDLFPKKSSAIENRCSCMCISGILFVKLYITKCYTSTEPAFELVIFVLSFKGKYWSCVESGSVIKYVRLTIKLWYIWLVILSIYELTKLYQFEYQSPYINITGLINRTYKTIDWLEYGFIDHYHLLWFTNLCAIIRQDVQFQMHYPQRIVPPVSYNTIYYR